MPRPIVIVDPSFGTRLRQLRREQGLSVRALGKLAGYVGAYIHEFETGRKRPSPENAARLDDALCSGGALSRLVTVPAATEPLTLDDAERLAYITEHPARVDQAAVDALGVVLADERRREDVMGAAPLVEPVTRQLAGIVELVRDARGAVRPAVVDQAAQWAQFAGWLNTALRRPATAEEWLNQALAWALEAGNVDMVSTVLSFKGHLAWTLGHVGPMVGLTQAARRHSGVYVGQLAYDALQEARGHAVAGEVADVETNVAESRDLAAQSAEYRGPVPPWHYYRVPAFFRLERGRVFRYLGAAAADGHNMRAVDELRTGLEALPADMRGAEWTASYLLDLAVAHAQDGDRAAALTITDGVERIARATGSKGLAGQVGGLRRRLLNR